MNSFTDVILETARLSLRMPVAADAGAVFAMRADPVVQRYGSHPPWTDPATAVAWIERSGRAMASGEHAHFAIARREDGAVVGTCTLERLGFVREGHLRERWIVGGEVCDSFFYGLLRSEWKARRESV